MEEDRPTAADADNMSSCPLLLLIDGLLSQDEIRVRNAAIEITRSLQQPPPPHLGAGPKILIPPNVLQQASWLYGLLSSYLTRFPAAAMTRSGHDGSLPLHFAASYGDVHLASLILSKCPESACTPNEKGKIPLHYAAREGRLDMVNLFLREAPRTASIMSKKRKLAVHFAAGDGHLEVCRALLRVYPQGASTVSAKGKLALHFCSRWGHTDIAHDLLAIYPQAVRALDYEGSLPLHDAAREGQFEMAQLLIQAFPAGLTTANMRGEVPLFPAVRSGNLDLICWMVQAWPFGGKHVLQRIRAEDEVESWDADVVDLLLRGAVNCLEGCELLQGRDMPRVQLWLEDAISTCTGAAAAAKSPKSDESKLTKKQKKKLKKEAAAAAVAKGSDVSPRLMEIPESITIATTATLERCKSPILQDQKHDDKKRSPDDVNSSSSCAKRRRLPARPSDDEVSTSSSTERTFFTQGDVAQRRRYLSLHAALECRASLPVVQHVLNEHFDPLHVPDDLNRFPLHWAVMASKKRPDYDVGEGQGADQMIKLIESSLLTDTAIRHRDASGNLPLHLAIASRAHYKMIACLLKAYPDAGVEPCGEHGLRPPFMACHHKCELDTVYQLLRVDPSIAQRKQQQN